MPSPTPDIRRTSAIMPRRIMRGHTKRIRCVMHLPGGRRTLTCSDDGSLRLWDLGSGTQIGEDWRDEDDEGRPVLTMALSPNGKTVATGCTAGIVRLWDVETKRVVTKWNGGDATFWSMCWSADGERVASGSGDDMLRVWDVESGKIVLGPIQTGYGNVYATVYSPDTTKIATGGDSENGIKIWDATTGKLLSTVELFEAVWSLVWTSDQKKLISGSVLGPVRIFNTATWQQIAILQGHESPILTISLFRSDRFLGSASYDKTARLWDLDTNLPVGPPLQHKELVDGAAISADGKLLVAGCMDRNAYIWDIQTILTEAGIEDLLCTTNVAAKSLMDIDATRLRAQREHARQVPRGFFDDRQDGVHSSTRRLRSPTHRLRALTPSSTSTSHSYALFANFSSLFRRSQLNTDESIELQQPPPRSAVSGHSPHAIDVAAVRDKEALYVARRPERTSEQATRIENPTWWTRCILFICCVSTQRTEGHQ